MIKPAFLDSVWQDMGAVHRDERLAAACLVVQERFAVDVPLLLLLCLADHFQSAPSRDDLVSYIEQSSIWRQSVIVPIRTVRQTMKTAFIAPAEQALRDQIKRVELEAERLHVTRLVENYPPVATQQASAAPFYLGLCHAPTTDCGAFITTFATAFDAQIRLAVAKA